MVTCISLSGCLHVLFFNRTGACFRDSDELADLSSVMSLCLSHRQPLCISASGGHKQYVCTPCTGPSAQLHRINRSVSPCMPHSQHAKPSAAAARCAAQPSVVWEDPDILTVDGNAVPRSAKQRTVLWCSCAVERWIECWVVLLGGVDESCVCELRVLGEELNNASSEQPSCVACGSVAPGVPLLSVHSLHLHLLRPYEQLHEADGPRSMGSLPPSSFRLLRGGFSVAATVAVAPAGATVVADVPVAAGASPAAAAGEAAAGAVVVVAAVDVAAVVAAVAAAVVATSSVQAVLPLSRFWSVGGALMLASVRGYEPVVVAGSFSAC